MNRITPSDINQNFLNVLNDKYTKEQVDTMMNNVNSEISKNSKDLSNLGGPNYLLQSNFGHYGNFAPSKDAVGDFSQSGYTHTYQNIFPVYSDAILLLASFNKPYGQLTTMTAKTDNQSIQAGWVYTASFICAYSLDNGLYPTPMCNVVCYISENGSTVSSTQKFPFEIPQNHPNGWVGAKCTFTAPYNTLYVGIELGFTSTNNAWMVFDGLKVEAGFVATDWRPSYLDQEALDAEQSKEITQLETEATNNTNRDTALQNQINALIPSASNAPSDHDCNSFTTNNSGFVWDTGNGAFNNTPLGNLKANSGIVFSVENIGEQGRIQQIFRQVYPPTSENIWIRNWSAAGGAPSATWGTWQQIATTAQLLSLQQEVQQNHNTLTTLQTLLSNGDQKLSGQLFSNTMTCPSDANDALTFGVYNIANVGATKVANLPPNSDTYGILIVYTAYKETITFGPTYGWVWQAFYTTNGTIWFRNKSNNNPWSSWATLAISNTSELSILNPQYFGGITLPTANWANSSINTLPVLGGGQMSSSIGNSSNIVYSALGNNSVNMVIDGEFYGSTGQIPVIKSIQNNTNAINAIQTSITKGMPSAISNGQPNHNIAFINGSISNFTITESQLTGAVSSTAVVTVQASNPITKNGLSESIQNAIANNSYQVTNINLSANYIGKGQDACVGKTFASNFISVDAIDVKLIPNSDNYSIQFNLSITNMYDSIVGYTLSSDFSFQLIY